MPRDEERKLKNLYKQKNDEPEITGVKKVLEARRAAGSKKTEESLPKEPGKQEKKSPSILDTLTHIPEQLLDAESRMMSQVQPNKDLEKRLEEANKRADNYLDQLRYLQADFDNYRKRTDRERQEFVKFASEGLMKDILTFLDEFELSISAVKDEKMKESFTLLQKNLTKILQNRGLEKIDALGKSLDPYFHEVLVMQLSDKAEGTILMEVQKGYKLNGRVIRYSKVVVSAGNQKKGKDNQTLGEAQA
jgi:molecular chaperone GrpE